VNIVYLVVLYDSPSAEIQTAWTTSELAAAEVKRQLDAEEGPPYYWLQNRLNVVPVQVSA